jgi:aminoglycoside phosphotransferase (APT) family kinase protein
MIPGEPVLYASRRPGPDFARDLGALIRQIESFPVDNAVELGVPYIDGDGLRLQRSRHYEAVIREVFPVVSCEARMRIEQVFETYLNDDANFDFEPRLVHQDLDMNVLIDEESGELSGVIDWGGAVISNPALDLWLPTYGFQRLEMAGQTAACLEAAGLRDELPRLQGEVDFVDFNFPLTDILSGLNRRDSAQVEDGIKALNASLPRELRCP